MSNEKIIIFRKNEKDEYFRKSADYASADVILKDDSKLSGSIERLSATILKGVQDQLFSITRQKQIEIASKELTEKLSAEYQQSFIDNLVKRAKKNASGKTLDKVREEAERSYEIKKKSIDRLAEKEAWRITIRSEINEDELLFKFDASSILQYAKVNGVKKDRLYEDVRRVQERFNRWTEKRFDPVTGKVEDTEINGVLFPYSMYRHGENSTIEIKLEKELLHCVLFLNKNFLRYHLDSYIKVETPNATRLYELLVDSISGNLFVSGRELNFLYLQKKFNTNYKIFRQFLDRLMGPSLQKINSELGTNITWVVDKKKGKSIESIKFVINDYDQRVLFGMRDDDIDDMVLYSFEYYVALVSLGGQKAQGGLKALYEYTRGQISEGTFSFFDRTKEEMVQEHMKNLEDAEEIEALIDSDDALSELFAYDKKYMNIIDRNDLSFVGTTATESLEYIRSSYLIPKGFLSPPLPFFKNHEEEKEAIRQILPLRFKLTERKTIIIDETNYDAIKITIEPFLKDVERFIFNTAEEKKRYCETFGIESFMGMSFDAEIVDEPIFTKPIDSNLFSKLETIMLSVGNRNFLNHQEKWSDALNDLSDEYGVLPVSKVLDFLSSGSKDSIFWLKNITTTTKLFKHFEQIEQVSNILATGFIEKIKTDYEIQACISKMRSIGESEEAISAQVNQIIQDKYSEQFKKHSIPENEKPWDKVKRLKRENGEALSNTLNTMGYENIFDFLNNRVDS